MLHTNASSCRAAFTDNRFKQSLKFSLPNFSANIATFKKAFVSPEFNVVSAVLMRTVYRDSLRRAETCTRRQKISSTISMSGLAIAAFQTCSTCSSLRTSTADRNITSFALLDTTSLCTDCENTRSSRSFFKHHRDNLCTSSSDVSVPSSTNSPIRSSVGAGSLLKGLLDPIQFHAKHCGSLSSSLLLLCW